MVVRARSLGIPARLAVGYAPGTYDERRGRFLVREKDAHSWPELYFPGYGWIPFEPTAARPVFLSQSQLRRSQEANQALVEQALRALRWQGIWQQVVGWGRWVVLLGVVFVLGRWLWVEIRLRRQAQDPWHLVWLRLERLSPRFGLVSYPGQTPRELALAWGEVLMTRYPQHVHAQSLARSIFALAQGVEARWYAPGPLRPADGDARRAWQPVRWGLFRLRYGRWLGRFFEESHQ